MTRSDAAQFQSRLLQTAEKVRTDSNTLDFPEVPPDPAEELAESDPDDIAFVTETYARILGRKPDALGLLHHVRHLRQGIPRVLILDRLYSSAEARALGRAQEQRPGRVELWWGRTQQWICGEIVQPLHRFLARSVGSPDALPSKKQIEKLQSIIDTLLAETRRKDIAALESQIAELTRRQAALESNIEGLLRDAKAGIRDEIVAVLWTAFPPK